MTELWKLSPEEQAVIFSDAFMRIQAYQLNHVGSHIWYLTDGKRTVTDIADEIYNSIDAGNRPPKELIQRDVIDFIVEARENYLIELLYPAKEVDILLVLPPNSRYYHKKICQVPENSSPPLGLCSIATILNKNGIKVHLEDFQVAEKSSDQIIPLIELYNPKVIGISATTTTFVQAKQMAETIRRYYPAITLILGGIHGSAMPEESLLTSSFDIVVRGEGELTTLELARMLFLHEKDLSVIQGISYKTSSGAVCHNLDRPYIDDLDTLPAPDKRMTDLYRYYQKGAILTGRGCPNSCIFCSCGAFSGKKYRARSVKHILDEIKDTITRFGITEFEIHDDTFTISKNRVISFCKELLKEGLAITWGCQSRVSTIDEDLAKLMFDAGCRSIQFGVESGNQAVLHSIKKGITLEQVERAVMSAYKAGIPNIICTFMIGHPEDTRDTIRDTVNFALRLHDIGVTITPFTVLTPLPGTDVYHRAGEYGLKIISDDWERDTFSKVNIENKNLKAEEIQEIYFNILETILTKEGRFN
jgi:radical SAM superfamily enzyme YgiQ (UPF0313 family)